MAILGIFWAFLISTLVLGAALTTLFVGIAILSTWQFWVAMFLLCLLATLRKEHLRRRGYTHH